LCVPGGKGACAQNVWDTRFGTLGLSASVMATAATASDVYVGGAFTAAGGNPMFAISRWTGTSWVPLGPGLNGTVLAIALSGTDVYAGGQFTSTTMGQQLLRIGRWNGSSWSALGTGVANGQVNAMAASGGTVYAVGDFTVVGGVTALRVARWNGSAWSALGTGLSAAGSAAVISGSDLYVGGLFTTAGGVAAFRIARWNGSAWSALAGGVSGPVYALATDGLGSVYAGGDFTTADGKQALRIARWNGSTWSALGGGLSGPVYAIAVDGSNVYVGGDFTTAGGGSALRVAHWNGSTWSALGTGPSATVRAVSTRSGDVYVGGDFTAVDGIASNYFGRWGSAFVPVLIESFSAEPMASAVRLDWSMYADEAVLGYAVYRADEGSSSFRRIFSSTAVAPVGQYVDFSVTPGQTYQYYVAIERAGAGPVRSPVRTVVTRYVRTHLGAAYPNPFNPSTTIPLDLASPAYVNLSIFDIAGHLVRRLVAGERPAGHYTVHWDGHGDNGAIVPSGVYFARLRTVPGGRAENTKLVVVR